MTKEKFNYTKDGNLNIGYYYHSMNNRQRQSMFCKLLPARKHRYEKMQIIVCAAEYAGIPLDSKLRYDLIFLLEHGEIILDNSQDVIHILDLLSIEYEISEFLGESELSITDAQFLNDMREFLYDNMEE